MKTKNPELARKKIQYHRVKQWLRLKRCKQRKINCFSGLFFLVYSFQFRERILVSVERVEGVGEQMGLHSPTSELWTVCLAHA